MYRLVRTIDARPRPWRNGGGLTRELLALPAADDWRVRVSVAAIERDGPFSAFPGVERWFAVLDGAGVELTIDGRAYRLLRGDAPLSFSGAAETHCRLLAGPTQDLNLMLRGVRGAMQPAVDGQPYRAPPGAACGLFSAVAGRCDGVELAPRTLLWFERPPAALTFHAAQRGTRPHGWWLTVETERSAG
ncbi:MAG TPA: HutD family protein [Burkholderiaceae bacterium]|jgi:hypothetical protein|nr:HutD family protein [Burkholderiaceae bacterium]